jgi:hypothetical protein
MREREREKERITLLLTSIYPTKLASASNSVPYASDSVPYVPFCTSTRDSSLVSLNSLSGSLLDARVKG